MADQAPANRGLYITPVRKYITVEAGKSKTDSLTIGNFTDRTTTVSLEVNQFSVDDYTYGYQFSQAAGTQLVALGVKEVTLKPNESKTIPYTTSIPAGSTPGGRYYTILATATVHNGQTQQKIQTASLLYITIDGTLVRTNQPGASSIKKLVFGKQIPFSMDVSNTGNTHYFMYLSASLHGPLTSKSATSSSHLLLPIKTRHINSSIPSPILPGLYRATYGYRTEYSPTIEQSAYIVYLPPWSLVLVILIIWIALRLWRKRRNHARPHRSNKSKTDVNSPSDTAPHKAVAKD